MSSGSADPADRAAAVEALLSTPTARLASAGADFQRVVVLADSLSFHGPAGPVPLAEPRLYPNVMGRRLDALTGHEWAVQVWGRAGWGMRELWLALQKDVHLQQQLLVGADAVVLAMGSADQLSVGIPRGVLAPLPFVRPTRLRRALRRGIDRVHARLVRLTGGRMRHTPTSVVAHGYAKSVAAIRLFAGADVPLIGIIPADHRTTYFGGVRRHHDEVCALARRLAREHDVPTVDLSAMTRHRLDELNVDGAHWSWAIHADVGRAFADALAAHLFPGEARTPSAAGAGQARATGATSAPGPGTDDHR